MVRVCDEETHCGVSMVGVPVTFNVENETAVYVLTDGDGIAAVNETFPIVRIAKF